MITYWLAKSVSLVGDRNTTFVLTNQIQIKFHDDNTALIDKNVVGVFLVGDRNTRVDAFLQR